MWYSCTIAIGAWLVVDEHLSGTDLGCGLRLTKTPDWVKADDALKLMSWNDRENIRDSDWCIATEYKADALGSPDPAWQGQQPRSIQSTVDEKFTLVSVALWLAKPTPLTCGPVLHFNEVGRSDSLRQSSKLRPVLIRDDENENTIDSEDLSLARSLFKNIVGLRRDATCWIAIRMLVRALTESMWEARYLWQWIVLEALFGPDSPTETKHRLSQRIALFTENAAPNRREAFELAKKAYDWRSKLVHGRKLSKLTPEGSKELTTFVEAVLRRSFVTILSNQNLVNQFDSKRRDPELEALAFT